MSSDKIAGCLFGMALGDALGAETEFLDVAGILKRFPPTGPVAPRGNPALVTDDTQMALAVGEALIAAPRPYAPDTLGDAIKSAFIDWYNDPQNTALPAIPASLPVKISSKAWTGKTPRRSAPKAAAQTCASCL